MALTKQEKNKLKKLKAKKKAGTLGEKGAAKLAALQAARRASKTDPDAPKTSKQQAKEKAKELGLNDKQTNKLVKESGKSDVAGAISEKNVNKGVEIGKALAPDVIDTPFLDRIQAQRTGDVDNLLANYDQNRQQALVDSPELQYSLNTLKQRAEAGYTPQEREALGLNARTSINQTLNTGLRAAQAFNLNRGIRGGVAGAAFNPALIQAVTSRRGLENDIMLAEMAEKTRALSEFSGLVQNRDQNRTSNLLNIDTGKSNVVNTDRAYTSDVAKYNAEQAAKEIAARTARNATGLGIVTDERDVLRQDDLINKQLKQSKKNLDQLLSIV